MLHSGEIKVYALVRCYFIFVCEDLLASWSTEKRNLSSFCRRRRRHIDDDAERHDSFRDCRLSQGVKILTGEDAGGMGGGASGKREGIETRREGRWEAVRWIGQR